MNHQVHVIPHDQFKDVDHAEHVTEESLLSVVRCLVAESPERKRISYPAFHAIPLDIDGGVIGKTYSVYPQDAYDRYQTFMEVLENAHYINGMFQNMYGPVVDGQPTIDSFVYVVSTQYEFDVHDMRALTLAMKCLSSHPDNIQISAFVVSTDIDFYIIPSFTSLM
jgi:hypothetical protein